MSTSNPFQSGGTLPFKQGSYIKRDADMQLLAALQDGQYAYFFAAPQSGKSSLMVHARETLKAEREPPNFAFVDLSPQMAEWAEQPSLSATPGALQHLFIESCSEQLGVPYAPTGSNEELYRFFRSALRRHSGRIIVLIDEVNCFLDMPGSGSLFSNIRNFYNRRAAAASEDERSDWCRLQFVLAGFAVVKDLVKDPRLSPFNVSHEIRLDDLNEEQTRFLVEKLHSNDWEVDDGAVASEVYRYVSGSVYLSQYLLSQTWRCASDSNAKQIGTELVRQVAESIIDRADSDRHFCGIRDAIVRSRDLERAARELADSGRLPGKETLVRLQLTGIANSACTGIRNEMYRRVFFAAGATMPLGQATLRTIGVVVTTLTDSYQGRIVAAALQKARETRWNVLIFSGATLKDSVFDIISTANVSALIVICGAFHVAREDIREFSRRFKGIPIVSVAMRGAGEDVPIVVQNRAGVESMMGHLIDVHGLRRIAFIKGPPQDYDAQGRYDGYKAALASHGLEFDAKLVLDGDYTPKAGRDAVDQLIDSKVDFDAIFAANDRMAIGVLYQLNRAKRACAVVGFDDVEDARAMSPSLTTVEQPLKDLGREAVAAAAVLVEHMGAAVYYREYPTTPRYRESCGCDVTFGRSMSEGSPTHTHQELTVFLRQLRLPQEPLSALESAIDRYVADRVDRSRARRAFTADVRRALGPVVAGWGVDARHSEGDDPFALMSWHHALVAMTTLIRSAASGITDDEVEELRECAWGEVVAAAQRVRIRQKSESRRIAQALGSLSRSLFAGRKVQDVLNAVLAELPQVGIPGCAIVQYVQEQLPSEHSVCLLEFDDRNTSRDIPLETKDVIPTVRAAASKFAKVIMPLRSERSDIGYIVFDVDPSIDWALYHQVAEEVGGALQSARIYTEHQQYALTLAGLPNLTRDLSVLGGKAGTLHDVLQRCAAAGKEALRADLVAIYEWQAAAASGDAGRFVFDLQGPPRAGHFYEDHVMTGQDYPLDRVKEVIDGGGGFYGTERYAQEYRSGPRAIGRPGRKPFAFRENIHAMAALPLEIGQRKVGVMFVNYRSTHEFTDQEQDVHRAFATVAAIAIGQKQILARTVTDTRRILDKVLTPVAERSAELITEYANSRSDRGGQFFDFIRRLRWMADAYRPENAEMLNKTAIESQLQVAALTREITVGYELEDAELRAFAVRAHLRDVVSTLIRVAKEQGASTVTIVGRWVSTAVLLTIEDDGRLHEEPEQLFELPKEREVPWNDGRTLWWCHLTMLSDGAVIEYAPKAGRNCFVLRLPGHSSVSCW